MCVLAKYISKISLSACLVAYHDWFCQLKGICLWRSKMDLAKQFGSCQPLWGRGRRESFHALCTAACHGPAVTHFLTFNLWMVTGCMQVAPLLMPAVCNGCLYWHFTICFSCVAGVLSFTWTWIGEIRQTALAAHWSSNQDWKWC